MVRGAGILLAVLLAGCASPEEVRQRQLAQEQYLMDSLRARCDSFGVPRETSQYSQCLQNLYQQQAMQAAYEKQARHNAAMQALGAAALVNQASQPYTLPSGGLNCTTYQRGPYGNINCY